MPTVPSSGCGLQITPTPTTQVLQPPAAPSFFSPVMVSPSTSGLPRNAVVGYTTASTSAPPAPSHQLALTPKSPIPGWTVVGTLAPGTTATVENSNAPTIEAATSPADAAISIINNAIAALNSQSAQDQRQQHSRSLQPLQTLQLQDGVLTLTPTVAAQPEAAERVYGVR